MSAYIKEMTSSPVKPLETENGFVLQLLALQILIRSVQFWQKSM